MDAAANHVVIVGGPEAEDELLAIVLDDPKKRCRCSTRLRRPRSSWTPIGEFGEDWRAREVSAQELIALLEYQGEEVEYVALSPPPERMEGGMEVQLLYREILIDLLRRQTATEPRSEERGFWRRLFGR